MKKLLQQFDDLNFIFPFLKTEEEKENWTNKMHKINLKIQNHENNSNHA